MTNINIVVIDILCIMFNEDVILILKILNVFKNWLRGRHLTISNVVL